jgi:hypothetical protein
MIKKRYIITILNHKKYMPYTFASDSNLLNDFLCKHCKQFPDTLIICRCNADNDVITCSKCINYNHTCNKSIELDIPYTRLNQAIVKCTNAGCDYENTRLNYLTTHAKTCPYELYVCTQCNNVTSYTNEKSIYHLLECDSTSSIMKSSLNLLIELYETRISKLYSIGSS